eukprot:SAG11_NODE_36581_length_260_cov_18.496894_1_plen_67_part_01
MSLSQSSPAKPATHAQLYVAIDSEHVPPFWQGLLKHSSMSLSQSSPAKPATHAQLYVAIDSEHVPPF